MVIANFRLFYKRLIKFCKKKNSKFFLYFISFIESIFFPLPTDPFLIPFVIAEKKFFLNTVFVTFFSVLGGVIAYFIGNILWENLESSIITFFPSIGESVKVFQNEFSELGFLLIVIGGFSPFPYKVTCLGSGILGINLFGFIFFSLVSRGARFFLVSFLTYKYGEMAINFIQKYILRISLIILVIILFVFFKNYY